MVYMYGDKFFYVFSKDARDELLAAGYMIIKNDEHNNMYIFENKKNLTFDKKKVKHLETNTLTF